MKARENQNEKTKERSEIDNENRGRDPEKCPGIERKGSLKGKWSEECKSGERKVEEGGKK